MKTKSLFSERWAKLPFIPFYLKTTDFLPVLTNPNQMDVHHYVPKLIILQTNI